MRRVRKGFIYPNVGLKEALVVWYYGGYYPTSCLEEDELLNGERVRFPPLRLVTCHDLERHNHGRRSKWFKVLSSVTKFIPNIPEYPSMSQLVEIMEAGKHVVMAPSLKNDIDQLSNTINTMYDYVIKNGISSTTGKLKRKKSSGSSSNIRRKSLPRAAKNTTARKLTQIQVFLDEREHQESQQQVL